jgi:hypothetical protein
MSSEKYSPSPTPRETRGTESIVTVILHADSFRWRAHPPPISLAVETHAHVRDEIAEHEDEIG